jgi:hypothetical protein
LEKALVHLLELVEVVDRPGDVVHADRAPARFGRSGLLADREERDVVVVGRLGRAEELETALRVVDDQREPEHLLVERRAAPGVADVHDRVVHAGDGHQNSPFGLMVRP